MEYLVPQPTFYKSKALCVCVCMCAQCIPSEWVFGLTADQVLETVCSFCEDMLCVLSTTCKCFWKNRPPSLFLEDSLEKQLEK
jgi:hypothetical protein